MKTSFVLSAIVLAAITNRDKTTNIAKLTQAVESNLNAFKVVGERSEITKAKADDSLTSVTERGEVDYTGKTDIVSRFFVWHTEVVKFARKGEKLGCVAMVAEIPPRFNEWLDRFTAKGARTQSAVKSGKAERKGEKPASNGNGSTPATRATAPTVAA